MFSKARQARPWPKPSRRWCGFLCLFLGAEVPSFSSFSHPILWEFRVTWREPPRYEIQNFWKSQRSHVLFFNNCPPLARLFCRCFLFEHLPRAEAFRKGAEWQVGQFSAGVVDLLSLQIPNGNVEMQLFIRENECDQEVNFSIFSGIQVLRARLWTVGPVVELGGWQIHGSKGWR